MKRLFWPVLLIVTVMLWGSACAPAPSAPGGSPGKVYPVLTQSPATPGPAQTAAPTAVAAPAPAYPVATKAPAVDGKALMNERCTVCHSTDRIQAAKKDKAGWQATVTRMKGKGAILNDAETQALIDFLAATYK